MFTYDSIGSSTKATLFVIANSHPHTEITWIYIYPPNPVISLKFLFSPLLFFWYNHLSFKGIISKIGEKSLSSDSQLWDSSDSSDHQQHHLEICHKCKFLGSTFVTTISENLGIGSRNVPLTSPQGILIDI